MFAYRQSYMQNTLAEWHATGLWALTWHSALLFASIAVLAISWPAASAWPIGCCSPCSPGLAVMALRNVIFLALIAPVVIASYLPAWKRAIPRWAEFAMAIAIAAIAGERIANGTRSNSMWPHGSFPMARQVLERSQRLRAHVQPL